MAHEIFYAVSRSLGIIYCTGLVGSVDTVGLLLVNVILYEDFYFWKIQLERFQAILDFLIIILGEDYFLPYL